ncbi:MAG: hypothetical protein KF688_18780 [Pirellulales bacterium]|nr:hypothetical protein [Pirellulales bacterium]
MMQACFAVLALLLSSQVQGGRYDAEPAAEAAATPETAVPDPAAPAERPQFQYVDQPQGAPAGNVLRAQPTPQPTLPAGFTPHASSAGNFNEELVQPSVTPLDAQADSAAAVSRPRELMQLVLETPPTGSQLAGTPIELMTAVAGATGRREQTQLATAYWDLSAAVADYYLALQESAELRSLAAGIAAPNESWNRAAGQLQVRLATALKRAQAAQSRLQGLMGPAAGDRVPLPADAPHAGRYDTRYEEIFADRDDPAALQLHDLIPAEFDNISRLCDAVVEADLWLQRGPGSANDPGGEHVLRAHELLSLRRREFVEAVRQYNQHIAEYSELATPGRVETRRLVAMLIKTSTTAGSAPVGGRFDAAVQGASASEPMLANDAAEAERLPAVPPTYASEQDAPQQAAPEAEETRVRRPILDNLRDREHSILRRPLNRLRGDRRG